MALITVPNQPTNAAAAVSPTVSHSGTTAAPADAATAAPVVGTLAKTDSSATTPHATTIAGHQATFTTPSNKASTGASSNIASVPANGSLAGPVPVTKQADTSLTVATTSASRAGDSVTSSSLTKQAERTSATGMHCFNRHVFHFIFENQWRLYAVPNLAYFFLIKS